MKLGAREVLGLSLPFPPEALSFGPLAFLITKLSIISIAEFEYLAWVGACFSPALSIADAFQAIEFDDRGDRFNRTPATDR